MSVLFLERPAPVNAVTGSVHFIEPGREKPVVTYRAKSGTPETDANYQPSDILVRNARGDRLDLDAHGFQLVPHISSVRDFDNEDEVFGLGREEAADLVAVATGAAHVFVFDHTRRRNTPGAARLPSTRVHVDYTATSAPARVRDFFGAGADRLLAKRIAFINVWRPLKWPAEDWPLALADARSITPSDLIATDIVYPDRSGEIYGLRYNPTQRWSYIPSMQLDETLLIKCYDSRTDIARFTPHTAFADPTAPSDAPPRHSIEFRTMAFFD